MKGRHDNNDVTLIIDVAELHGSASSGQSEWVEVGYTGANGRRGVIRIERRGPTPDGIKRLHL